MDNQGRHLFSEIVISWSKGSTVIKPQPKTLVLFSEHKLDTTLRFTQFFTNSFKRFVFLCSLLQIAYLSNPHAGKHHSKTRNFKSHTPMTIEKMSAFTAFVATTKPSSTPATGPGGPGLRPGPSKGSREAGAVPLRPKPGAGGAGGRSTKSCVGAENLRSLLCDQPRERPGKRQQTPPPQAVLAGGGRRGSALPGRRAGALDGSREPDPALAVWSEKVGGFFWREEKPPVGRQGKGTRSPASAGCGGARARGQEPPSPRGRCRP